MDNEYGARGVCDHVGGHAAQQVSHDAPPPVGADDDEAYLALDGDVDDAFPGRRRFDRHTVSVEPCCGGQNCPVGSGFFGCLFHLGSLVGVEVSFGGGHESDIGWLPDAQDYCFPLECELLRGLFDGVSRELGSVVGEEHRAGD